MLLERDLIQSVGFRNVREGGRVTGFQFRLRMPSYRGMAASLIDGIAVRVGDLVDVGPTCRCGRFGGRTYTLQELWDGDGVRWPLEEAAIVTVPPRGGLPEGVHEVSIELRLRMSYIPVEHQPSDLPDQPQGHPRAGRRRRHLPVRRLPLQLHGRLRHGARPRDRDGRHRRHRRDRHRDPRRGPHPQLPGTRPRRGSTTGSACWRSTRSSPRTTAPGSTPACTPGPRHDGRGGRGGAAARPAACQALGFGFVRPKIGVVSSDLVPHPIWTESVERSLDLAEELTSSSAPRSTRRRRSSTRSSRSTSSSSNAPEPSTSASSSTPASSRTARSRCAQARLPRDRAPPSSTASASTPPTSPTSPSTSCSSRRSSTTSTRSSKTSRSPGSPCSGPSRTPATPATSPASTKANATPWRSIEQVRRHHSLMRRIAGALDLTPSPFPSQREQQCPTDSLPMTACASTPTVSRSP